MGAIVMSPHGGRIVDLYFMLFFLVIGGVAVIRILVDIKFSISRDG